MVLQAIGLAMLPALTLQMMMFVMSPGASARAAYADSWRKTGKVATHLFALQRGQDQRIAIAAFGTVAFYVALAGALDIATRFAH
ncbi:hypothetical protein LMG22037_05923 [Paraburkholderia phenoliruptrix]|uniref:Uncharacterized protein n=1 Tax=Paraburkholderia phenoliruptrix TaxID=252970 RepID=A0A6J5CGD0_9BURK|nr:hypothetical protein [Paraburkholderia phenoliruptrix]CAB3735024.1 hypothetical protein LMG22037_05923 [Paraburkholderia phenoliruptrix]